MVSINNVDDHLNSILVADFDSIFDPLLGCVNSLVDRPINIDWLGKYFIILCI